MSTSKLEIKPKSNDFEGKNKKVKSWKFYKESQKLIAKAKTASSIWLFVIFRKIWMKFLKIHNSRLFWSSIMYLFLKRLFYHWQKLLFFKDYGAPGIFLLFVTFALHRSILPYWGKILFYSSFVINFSSVFQLYCNFVIFYLQSDFLIWFSTFVRFGERRQRFHLGIFERFERDRENAEIFEFDHRELKILWNDLYFLSVCNNLLSCVWFIFFF